MTASRKSTNADGVLDAFVLRVLNERLNQNHMGLFFLHHVSFHWNRKGLTLDYDVISPQLYYTSDRGFEVGVL